jgi:hypothetical protein
MHVMSLSVSHKYDPFRETNHLFYVLSLTSYPFHTSFPWLLFFFCFLLLLSLLRLASALYSSSHDCHLKAVLFLENMDVLIVGLRQREGRAVSMLTHIYVL